MSDDPFGTDDDADRGRRTSGTDPDADRTDASRREDARGSIDGDRRGPDDRRGSDVQPGRRDRVPLDLSGPSDADADEVSESEDEDEYAHEANSTPIEPGDPDLENAVFVLLGAIAMVLVLVRLVSIPLG